MIAIYGENFLITFSDQTDQTNSYAVHNQFEMNPK